MSNFNISNVSWNTRPENSNNPIPINFHIDNILKVRVIGRIGSQSINGRVYEVDHNETMCRVALKTMMVDSISECKIAQKLGENYPHLFPRVITWKICPQVIVRSKHEKHTDIFFEHVEREFVKKSVVDIMDGSLVDKKRMRIKLRSLYTTDVDVVCVCRSVANFATTCGPPCVAKTTTFI